MWLFIRHGYYPLTRAADAPDKLHVRARLRSDLENPQKATTLTGQIHEIPTPDYRWRWIVTPAEAEEITRAG